MRYLLPILLICLTACGSEPSTQDSAGKREHAQIVNKVDTITLQRSDFRSELISNGRLRASQKSDLRFGGSGVVTTLNATNGQQVGQGATIATLNTEQEQLRLDQANQTMNKAQLDLQDALLGFGYSAQDTTAIPRETLRIAKLRSGYDAAVSGLRAAQLEMDGRYIKAPFGGKIANLKTKLHENPKGDFFCSLINDGSFDVEFTIIESEVGRVKEGQQVSVAIFNDPTKRYSGRVTTINPMVDDKGQVQVTATIPNIGSSLLDGMNVKIYMENMIPSKLVVPKSAVLIRDNREVLFTYGSDGKAHWVYVIIEASSSTSHAVRANKDRGAELEAGQSVIVSGNLNLADGSDVEIGTTL